MSDRHDLSHEVDRQHALQVAPNEYLGKEIKKEIPQAHPTMIWLPKGEEQIDDKWGIHWHGRRRRRRRAGARKTQTQTFRRTQDADADVQVHARRSRRRAGAIKTQTCKCT